jgi:tetratricopeptide (TPR) repeat protein
MPLCLSMCVAEENPQFVKVSKPSVNYEAISGMVKNGSEVTISVALTNFSKEIEGNESELLFHSDLEERVWGITKNGKECISPYIIDHREVTEVRITLRGRAPEVNKRTGEKITLLNITQKIKDEYPVICIKEYVTSEAIEDALSMWHEANETIAEANEAIVNAEEAGLNVAGARVSLALANEHLNNSQQYYNEGRPEEALEEANKALNSAKDAEAKAGSAVGGVTLRNYAIIAVVAVVVIIVFVLLLQQRRRKRGVY